MTGFDSAAINRMATVCLSNQHDHSWHYDIIALPDEAPELEDQLATLQFAKKKTPKNLAAEKTKQKNKQAKQTPKKPTPKTTPNSIPSRKTMSGGGMDLR